MNKPQIIVEPQPTQRLKHSNPEGKLQHDCVIWYASQFPQERKRLVAVFNESPSATQTQIKLSKGLCRGASDIILLSEEWGAVGIEMKYPGMKHSIQHIREQCEFLLSVSPHYGYFCDSLEMFQKIILTGSGGITPQQVLAYLSTTKGSSIVWDSKKICGENLEFNV